MIQNTQNILEIISTVKVRLQLATGLVAQLIIISIHHHLNTIHVY